MDNIELVKCQSNLPATLEDLSRFILIGREKLVSVRAEIRAIEKLNLAEQVRYQKKEECQLLAEALLDAEVRIGELLKALPKGGGGDRKSEEIKIRSSANFDKTKGEVIKEWDFSKDQAYRFETMADNKDLVEQVKAEARENDEIPTRSKVLALVKKRKGRRNKGKKNNISKRDCGGCSSNAGDSFGIALARMEKLTVDDMHLKAWGRCLMGFDSVEREREKVDRAIRKLVKMQDFLKQLKR